jgi:hypothetical protein
VEGDAIRKVAEDVELSLDIRQRCFRVSGGLIYESVNWTRDPSPILCRASFSITSPSPFCLGQMRLELTVSAFLNRISVHFSCSSASVPCRLLISSTRSTTPSLLQSELCRSTSESLTSPSLCPSSTLLLLTTSMARWKDGASSQEARPNCCVTKRAESLRRRGSPRLVFPPSRRRTKIFAWRGL